MMTLMKKWRKIFWLESKTEIECWHFLPPTDAVANAKKPVIRIQTLHYFISEKKASQKMLETEKKFNFPFFQIKIYLIELRQINDFELVKYFIKTIFFLSQQHKSIKIAMLFRLSSPKITGLSFKFVFSLFIFLLFILFMISNLKWDQV